MNNSSQTYKQAARQSARASGRYRDMNRCEGCKAALGEGYFSDPRTCNDGPGLVLCERCCTIGMGMTETAARAFYRRKRESAEGICGRGG